MIAYRSASEKDLFHLARLWRLCFEDGDDYPDRFLLRCLQKDGCEILCAEEKGEICGMACVVGVCYQDLHGGYLYAVCTHPDYRGRSICRTILKKAEEKRDFLCLIPAKPSLFDYYRSLGFTRPAFVATALGQVLGEVKTPTVLACRGFEDLILEGLQDASKKADRKVYKFCCNWQGQSVIMEEKGLFTENGAMHGELICDALPI